MKWLIIFPDPWLSYSPSILNFIKMLELYDQEFIIVYTNTNSFDNSKISFNSIKIEISRNQEKLLRACKLYKLYIYLSFIINIKKNINIDNLDKVVGIDSLGYVIARFFCINPIYYSLEVSRSLLNKIIFNIIKPSHLIIQSKQRKDYLAKNFNNVSYIQNSPISPRKKHKNTKYEGKLVYFGNIINSHGVEICLDALYRLKNETLTIKGTGSKIYINYLKDKYKDLFDERRVIIDTHYLKQEEIFHYLNNFDIGFCFYNMSIIGSNNFNYLSSPSGKIFNYLMCAIPVIGNKIIGMDTIEKNKAGILISEVNIDNIIKAVNDIKLDYHFFSENSYKVSCEFDYAKMFAENWNNISNSRET